MNHVIISGHLSSDPVMRTLASGSQLWSLEVTTDGTDGRSWSVPVSWFDPPSRQAGVMGRWAANQKVVVVGAIRRRYYRAAGRTASRTEVVADEVLATTQRSRVAAAIGASTTAVTAWLEAG